MTNRAAFTEDQWKTVLEGPSSAGMIVVTAGRGGTIRETFAIGKAYVEARKEHGESELLDEIVSAKPQIDHTRFHSYDELKQHGLELIRGAVAALQEKATPAELDGYRRFVLMLTDMVASAHREDGVMISEPEKSAIADITTALGGDGSGS